jgi:hypothetical protein
VGSERQGIRVPRFISALAERFGITRALVYTVLGRTWSVLAGPVSLMFVGRFLTKDEQGFYYTFWSVLGLWVFFDLGLSLIIVQFASHERASFRVVNGRVTGDPLAQQRLASLFRLALRWYGWAGALMIVIILPAGLIFFAHYRPPDVHVQWVLPWVLVVLSTAANVVMGPLASILEGSGMFQDVALMRLLQAMTANLLLWVALIAGGALYAAVILNGTMAIFTAAWIFTRHRGFFGDLAAIPAGGGEICWRTEVWPFQWRFAMSWMTGYFMFQVFNPILFATEGPRVAGQMGMSLMVTTAIWLFAQAWINTRAVDFGALVASRNFETLDRIFRNVLVQSSAVVVALSTAVIIGVEVLRRIGHPLAGRLLPPLPLIILIVATMLNHIVSAEATYLRSFKREPFVVIFPAIFVITVIGSLAVARPFGATGMVTVLAVAMAIVGIGCGTMLFMARRRQWRAEAAMPAASPIGVALVAGYDATPAD